MAHALYFIRIGCDTERYVYLCFLAIGRPQTQKRNPSHARLALELPRGKTSSQRYVAVKRKGKTFSDRTIARL
ncbi:hypothetical protein MPNT_60128 [Candidatus Methylacidithermus pantelleriae]|uniref:Uncharacterized protein n=1 Tax=Candidatus Methylacidithermus pantelleriae TaxID=2744239 RepID=A0A8J2BVG5_9BACT|nr:hypothetical protein MPNT_60128 [Candidatus Methylacidithermus pantelleriae]